MPQRHRTVPALVKLSTLKPLHCELRSDRQYICKQKITHVFELPFSHSTIPQDRARSCILYGQALNISFKHRTLSFRRTPLEIRLRLAKKSSAIYLQSYPITNRSGSERVISAGVETGGNPRGPRDLKRESADSCRRADVGQARDLERSTYSTVAAGCRAPVWAGVG